MTPPPARTAVAAVLAAVTLLLALTSGTSPILLTEAAWTDGVKATGTVGSGRWATSGSASAAALSTTMTVSVLLTGTVGPVGPAQASSADGTHPGPDTKGPATVDLFGYLRSPLNFPMDGRTSGWTGKLDSNEVVLNVKPAK